MINTVFLLNTPIEKLYNEKYLKTRVFLNLKALKIMTLSQLFNIIKESQVDDKKRKELEIFGQRSINELNDLFDQANIKLPEFW